MSQRECVHGAGRTTLLNHRPASSQGTDRSSAQQEAGPDRERDAVVRVVLVHKAVVDQEAPVGLGPAPGQHILPRLVRPVADQLHMLAADVVPQHGLRAAVLRSALCTLCSMCDSCRGLCCVAERACMGWAA